MVFLPGNPPVCGPAMAAYCWEQLPRGRALIEDALTSTGGCRSLGVNHTIFCPTVHLASAVTVMKKKGLFPHLREPEDRKEA